jgi:hypothetical protein
MSSAAMEAAREHMSVDRIARRWKDAFEMLPQREHRRQPTGFARAPRRAPAAERSAALATVPERRRHG